MAEFERQFMTPGALDLWTEVELGCKHDYVYAVFGTRPDAVKWMSELEIHWWLTLLMFGMAAAAFIALFFITAPYGRHARAGWGPTLPSRVGWVVMEAPAPLLFLGIFMQGQHRFATVPLAFLALWQLHYVNRTFVFPFRMRASGKRNPVATIFMAIVFNCLNAYLNARWVSEFGDYPNSYLGHPALIAGVVVFIVGFAINQHADTVLLGLRKPGESGYRIPEGGLYRWISCPNYLGEILEWLGWAIAIQALAGWAFAVFTIANLAPRARTHHKWYRAQFPDYPPERRALIPGLW